MVAARNPEGQAVSASTKNETTMKVESDRELVISRTFNAPAPMVFDAWTRADLVRRWWAPRSHGVSLSLCEADVRVGGKYRYVLHREGSDDMGFSGEYREVTPHTRLVYTQVFEPMASAGAVIVSITFEARGQQTHLVSHERYPSKEALDSAMSAGMEHGMRETMDQLDDLVTTLASA